ncbi:MAG: hypothetical protein IT385_22905 [Deltaproteobacteria bacterium]|nr:hypothetical protein [Deltaproteobacteria bacterium]
MPVDPRFANAWERFLALIPVFLGVVHVGIWVLAGLTLGRLEGPFPIHFDVAGRPDDFADPSSWWTLPAIGAGILLFMLGVLALTRRLIKTHPGVVNVPRKADFLALPVEARLRIMPRASQLVLGLVLILHFVLLAIVRDTHRVALGELHAISVWKLVILLALVFVWVVVGLIRIGNAIRNERARTPA